jgi:hypothetical protein
MVQYLLSDGTRPTFSCQGLMDREAASPSKILVSSSESELSVLWLGRVGQLEVKKLIRLGIRDLYFTTSVVVKNIGDSAISNFYCKNSNDPIS